MTSHVIASLSLKNHDRKKSSSNSPRHRKGVVRKTRHRKNCSQKDVIGTSVVGKTVDIVTLLPYIISKPSYNFLQKNFRSLSFFKIDSKTLFPDPDLYPDPNLMFSEIWFHNTTSLCNKYAFLVFFDSFCSEVSI